MKILKKIFIFITITIIFIELASLIILKLKLTKNFEHSNLTFAFTEIDTNNLLNLKKNIAFKSNFNIFTDKNRLRVRNNGQETDLFNTNSKIVLLGDSVPFGWSLNYEDSLAGHLGELNNTYQIINAAVPSYSPKQSSKKFLSEFSNVKNIKYIYISNYNPVDLYFYFGKKWNDEINWSNYINFLSKDIFFFKYTTLPLWGEINFFKIMRKIYVIKFFDYSNNEFNERNLFSDRKIINLYLSQLEKIRNIKHENTKIIFTPIFSPIHLKKDLNLLSTFEKNQIELINKINFNLKNYKKDNFIFLDLVSILKNYNASDIFIDSCCHLSSKGSEIIANQINQIILNIDTNAK
jgi:hypothetical protein